MDKFKLKLEARNNTKPNQLRREGKIPATVYGPGAPSESTAVNAREFSRLPAAAYSHIIELEAAKGPVSAVVRNVQRDYTNNKVLNIEFYRVASDRKLTVTVPLKFVGVSPAVQLGGQILESFTDCEIECFPQDIPDVIEVDMTKILELDHGIHFGDLNVPASVKILNPPEEVIVRVNAPKAGSETPAAAATPAAAPAAAKKEEAAAAPAKDKEK